MITVIHGALIVGDEKTNVSFVFDSMTDGYDMVYRDRPEKRVILDAGGYFDLPRGDDTTEHLRMLLRDAGYIVIP